MRLPSSGTGGTSTTNAYLSEDGTKILVGNLVGSLLGGLWLTFVGGWISVGEAVARVHIRILDAIAGLYSGVLRAFGVGGAQTLRVSWAEAFRSATAADPVLAPLLLTMELVVVSWLLVYAQRRWTG